MLQLITTATFNDDCKFNITSAHDEEMINDLKYFHHVNPTGEILAIHFHEVAYHMASMNAELKDVKKIVTKITKFRR